MTYEHLAGMGRMNTWTFPPTEGVAPPIAPAPIYVPGYVAAGGPPRPTPPPAPAYPTLWRGSFQDAKLRGGVVTWGPRVGLLTAVRELVFRPPSGVTVARRAPTLSRCYTSGQSRTVEGAPSTSTSTVVRWIRPVVSEYEQCCYTSMFIAQKQAQNQVLMDAYSVQLEAYRNSPAYKAFERESQAWQMEREYEAQRQSRARKLARYPATTTPGDPCSPPGGGITGKLPVPIPRTRVAQAEQRLELLRLTEAGCTSQERLFDLEHLEMCCPPGVQVGPPPVVEEEGTTEETKYFGLTPVQLGIGALAVAGLAVLWTTRRKG